MKRVLMICFYFPPVGGAGLQRSSKFVKYLPQNGWMPTVTSAVYPGEHQDRTLLADIPDGVEVHRLPIPPTAWRRLREWMMRHRLGPIGLGRLATWIGYAKDFPDTNRELLIRGAPDIFAEVDELFAQRLINYKRV